MATTKEKPKTKTVKTGRPMGVKMPCGWCHEEFGAYGMRQHFIDCPKKPKK